MIDQHFIAAYNAEKDPKIREQMLAQKLEHELRVVRQYAVDIHDGGLIYSIIGDIIQQVMAYRSKLIESKFEDKKTYVVRIDVV